jgi:hypothetical protein
MKMGLANSYTSFQAVPDGKPSCLVKWMAVGDTNHLDAGCLDRGLDHYSSPIPFSKPSGNI